MISKIDSATTLGISSYKVNVEVDISPGLANFFIVGLPDTAIKESAKRITAALKNTGVRIPDKKITVNLAPANLKKEGTVFDLPIAIGILQSARLIEIGKEFLEETLFLGELSLDGSVNYVRGVLPVISDAKKLNKKRAVIPAGNYHEASLIPGIEIIGVKNLIETIEYLKSGNFNAPAKTENEAQAVASYDVDFEDVRGQEQAKRALLISAAGKHNILFIGSPGSGKTMLAKRLPTIMPEMLFEELIETSKIYSICGKLQNKNLISKRPFRNPHHTTSQAGLIGGGSYPQPGEVSLAHNGILFLDELTEFKRTTLEVLRQPLENKNAIIARVNQTVEFPSDFLMIAATNPCPCGFYMDKKKECACSRQQISKYLEKLSGPLLDRIDIQVPVFTVEYKEIKEKTEGVQTSAQLKNKVNIAVEIQRKRFGKNKFNGQMNTKEVEKYCTLTEDAECLLKKAFDALKLSMRGYHKILKTARTIADLEVCENIEAHHIKEAVSYRSLDNYLKS